jgi:hypothetical protein
LEQAQPPAHKCRDTILVTGYARLPEAEGRGDQSFFGITMEVDPRGDIILDGECSCSFEVGRKFFTSLLIGRSLTNDLDDIVHDFETRAAVPSQKTIIRSLQNAYNRYREFRLAKGPHDPVDQTQYSVRAVGGNNSSARQ